MIQFGRGKEDSHQSNTFPTIIAKRSNDYYQLEHLKIKFNAASPAAEVGREIFFFHINKNK